MIKGKEFKIEDIYLKQGNEQNIPHLELEQQKYDSERMIGGYSGTATAKKVLQGNYSLKTSVPLSTAEYASSYLVPAQEKRLDLEDSSKSLLPMVAQEAQLQAYKDMAKLTDDVSFGHPFDMQSLVEKSTKVRFEPKPAVKNMTTFQDKAAHEFTANIIAPIHNSADLARDSISSLLPVPSQDVQAQVYREMAQASSSSLHIELSPFSSIPSLDRSSSFNEMSRIETEFKQFAKSLLKEFKKNPQATLNQLARRAGQLFNPSTGKPVEKAFVARLLKEGKRLAMRSSIRSSVKPQEQSTKLSRSEKELLKAVTSLLSTPAPNFTFADEVHLFMYILTLVVFGFAIFYSRKTLIK